jgi:hypothetical protein
MAFKAAGAPCDLFREHILLNAGSFATANSTDDWRQEAHGLASPTRNIVRDATAYSTEPASPNWGARDKQGWVPANVGDGDGTAGGLT